MIMKKKYITSAVLALLINLGYADSNTALFQTNAQLSSSCQISSVDVSFGEYNPSQINNATGSLNVTCSRSVNYQIASNYGYYNYRNNKRMFITTDTDHSSSNGNYIAYTLYFNPSFSSTTLWGDGTYGYKIIGTGTGSSQSYPIYGQIAAGLYPKPATYADSVVATISY